MAVNTKQIKGRISSIKSIKKTTGAMEMISAVKMRRATERVLKSRGYASLAWEMLTDIGKKVDISLHPLLKTNQNPDAKIAVILITGNRGLAGGFTSRLLLEIKNTFTETDKEKIEIILLGKNGRKIYSQFGFTIAAEFEKADLTAKVEEIRTLSRMIISGYTEQKYNQVYLAYMDFKSAVIQTPRVKSLLPLSANEDDDLGKTDRIEKEAVKELKVEAEFKFEPSPEEALKALLPRLTEMQIYQAILESDSSEHSARMVAMKNASEAAEDMIKELNYSYNKARQAAITQEISEIVGGSAALE